MENRSSIVLNETDVMKRGDVVIMWLNCLDEPDEMVVEGWAGRYVGDLHGWGEQNIHVIRYTDDIVRYEYTVVVSQHKEFAEDFREFLAQLEDVEWVGFNIHPVQGD